MEGEERRDGWKGRVAKVPGVGVKSLKLLTHTVVLPGKVDSSIDCHQGVCRIWGPKAY